MTALKGVRFIAKAGTMGFSDGGFNPFGSWDEFSSIVNRAGFAWKNLIGQDRWSEWTPGLTFDAATGITYTSQAGLHYVFGKLLIGDFKITLSSKGSSTGNARLTGLPVAVANVRTITTPITYWANMATNLAYMSVAPTGGATTANIFGTTAASGSQSALTDTDFNNNSTIHGLILYGIS